MKIIKITILLIITITIYYNISYSGLIDNKAHGECTIGVFAGSVTSDGRPILWKNRDVYDFDQRFVYYQSYERDGLITIPFIGNAYRNDTTRIYMGANLESFSVINSDSYNLNDSLNIGIDDGTLMRIALETCADISEFELLLDSTNITGRKDCWNFGVIDKYGKCAIYECANYAYRKYQIGRSDIGSDDFIIRANFSLSGGNQTTGYSRYQRAKELTELRLNNNLIDAEFVLSVLARDLYNEFDDPYPLPYKRSQNGGPAGYIYTFFANIANRNTTSAAVIRGVAPGENPELATIFGMIGSPFQSLAYPLWVGAATVPVYLGRADGAPMYQICAARRPLLYDDPDFVLFVNSVKLLNPDNHGVYSYTLPLEEWGIEKADSLIAYWKLGSPSQADFSIAQFNIARAIFTGFQYESIDPITECSEFSELPQKIILRNYPNPFNLKTRISFDGFDVNSPVTVKIYDQLGRLVNILYGTNRSDNFVLWSGDDYNENPAASGVYIYVVESGQSRAKSKMTLLK